MNTRPRLDPEAAKRQRDAFFGAVTVIVLFVAGLCLYAGLFIAQRLACGIGC